MIHILPKPFAVTLALLSLVLLAKPMEAQPPKVDLPSHVKEHLGIVYGLKAEGRLHLDLFVPQADNPRPAILVVHGGGWHKGDKEKFRPLAKKLASHGFVTAAIEYRLAGEKRFPAAVDDCHQAVRWLRANAEKYNIDPKRIAAVGGSAGGHLVGMLATAPEHELLDRWGTNREHSSRIQAAIVLAGPWELATGTVAEKSRKEGDASNANRWLGKTVDEDPQLYKLASPLRHITKETPPTLFMAGQLDNPARNAAARSKLRELGIATDIKVYKDGKHGCWNREPWFTVMADDMAWFLRETLSCQFDAPQRTLLNNDEISLSADDSSVFVLLKKSTDGKVEIPRLNNPVSKVYAVDPKVSVNSLKPNLTTWTVTLPEAVASTVFNLDTVGTPYLPTVPRVLTAAIEGETLLPAHEAITHGTKLRYEPQPHKNTVGYWTNPEDWCQWFVYFDQPGKFDLHILQGCGKGHGGSTVAVIVGDNRVEFTVEDTGHFQNFKDRHLGQVTIEQPGVVEVNIKPIKKAKAAVMDVRQLRLVPQRP